MIQFTDTGIMDGQPRMTRDGYMVATARVARTGVQTYLRSELGLDGAGTINVYRPPEEVFNQDSLASYAFKPVTINHPSANVTSETWKDTARGHVGDQVTRDGEFVKVPFVLMDAQAIAAAKSTHPEISMGYTAEIVMKDGVAPDGQSYEAYQANIRINHQAFVTNARGGNKLRIGDSAEHWGASPVTDRATDQPKGNPMPDNLHRSDRPRRSSH
jgi:hypothetical protein